MGLSTMKIEITLREAWSKIVTADDYEGHMAEVGQAQANAELVRDLICDLAPPQGAKVLFAGAGTGQMFDYIDGTLFAPFDMTFTDINESFLAHLAAKA